MALTVARVGPNAQTLAPGPAVGADAGQVLIINLDLENTVNLGSSSTNLIFPLGPLASATLTAPVYAAAATTPLLVGIAPGGSSYSPGSLTITGPVTAEITGPVTVEGTVDIGSTVTAEITGTVDADVTGTVSISSGTVDATVTGTVDITSGTVTFTNATIDVAGIGGYILPGPTTVLINDSSTHTIPVSAGAGGAGDYITPLQDVQNYQSFNLAVTAHCSSQATAGGPLVMPVTVTWYADSAGSFVVESDTYWMWLVSNSAASPNYQLRGGGPAKGAYMTVGLFNLSATATIAVTQITLIGAGRAISQARFNQPAPYIDISSGVALLSTANEAEIQLTGYPDGSDGILCNESANTNIVAGDAYWLPMPLYTGPVWCRFSTSVALANDFVLATAAPLLNGDLAPGASSQGVIWNPGNTAGTDYTTILQLGNAPAYAVFKGGATAPTITLEIQGTAD